MGRVLVFLGLWWLAASAAQAQQVDGDWGGQTEAKAVPMADRPLSLVWGVGVSVLSPPRYHIDRSNTTLTAGVAVGPAISFSVLALAPLDLGLDFGLYSVNAGDYGVDRSLLLLTGAHAGYAHRLGSRTTLTFTARAVASRLSFSDADALTFGGGFGASSKLYYRFISAFSVWAELGALWLPFGNNGTTDIAMEPGVFLSLGFAAGTSRRAN